MNILESLDTLIAFVTIMTICSILVLILVQIAGSILSLRGKNMANALALTFQTIDPNLKEKAHRLAEKILTDPLLSDSMWRDKSRNEGEKEVVYQNAARAAWSPFRGMTLANAIRPQEVFQALKKLKEMTPTGTDQASQNIKELHETAKGLLELVGMPDEIAEAKVDALEKLTGGQGLTETQKALLGAEIAKVKLGISSMENELHSWLLAAQDRAEQWFRTHTRNITIVVSIGFAFFCQLDAIEIFHHVSQKAPREALVKASEQVLQQGDGILDEKEWVGKLLRERWNAAFPDKKLSEISQETSAPAAPAPAAPVPVVPVPVVPNHDSTALKALRKEAKELLDDSKTVTENLKKAREAAEGVWKSKDSALKGAVNGVDAAKTAVSKAKEEADKKTAEEGLAKAVANLAKAEADLAKVSEVDSFLKSAPDDFDSLFDAFEKAAFDDYLKLQKNRLTELQNIMGAAGFDILPKEGWRWRVKGDCWDNLWAVVRSQHMIGILMFAGLLTLGAPYWFNLLKNLASLRPALAQLIAGEKKESAK